MHKANWGQCNLELESAKVSAFGAGSQNMSVPEMSVTYILQKPTTRPQKCDAEVLPLRSANSTIQTSQRLEQKLHTDSQIPASLPWLAILCHDSHLG